MVTINPMIESDLANSTLVDLIKQQTDKVYQEIWQTGIRDPTSPIHHAFNQSLITQANQIANAKSKDVYKTINISPKLDPNEKEYLIRSWPEFTLNFLDNSNEDHAIAHASRICEERLILCNLNYFRTSNNGNIRLIDVGGNYLKHADRKYAIHSCCPDLSFKDSVRNTSKLLHFRTMSKSDEINLPFKKNLYFCNKIAQKCHIRSNSLMFLHSTYDLSTFDIADIMQNKQAMIAYGSIIFTPEILYKTSGYIKEIKCYWHIHRDYPCGPKKISFKFDKDYGENYEHYLSNYLSVLNTHITSTNRQNNYSIELSSRGNCLLIFKILKLEHPFPAGYSKFTIFKSALSGTYVVPCYYYDLSTASTDPKQHIRRKNIVVDKEFYDKMYSFALTKTGTQFSHENLVSAAQSFLNSIILNGSVVVSKYSLSPEESELISTNIFLRIYMSRWSQGKTIETIVEKIKEERKSAHDGWFTAAWKRIYDLITFKDRNHNEQQTAWLNKYIFNPLKIRVFANYYELEPMIEPVAIGMEEYIKKHETIPRAEDLFDDTIYTTTEDFNMSNVTINTPQDFEYIRPTDRLQNGTTLLRRMEGNCLYDTVLALTDNHISIRQFKDILLNTHFKFSAVRKDVIINDLKSDLSNSNIDCLAHISNYLKNYQFYVHTPVSSFTINKVDTERSSNTKDVHIFFSDEHFSPIFRETLELPSTKLSYINEEIQNEDLPDFKFSNYDDARMSYIHPTAVGYTHFNSLEIQELFYNIGRPKTVLLSQCHNKNNRSGILQYLTTTNLKIFTDQTFDDRGNYSKISLDSHPFILLNHVGIVDDIIVEKIDFDKFDNLFIMSNQDTRFIVNIHYLNAERIIEFLSSRFHNIEIHRSNFSPVTHRLFYAVCYGIDISDLSTPKFNPLEQQKCLKKMKSILYQTLHYAKYLETSNNNTMALSGDRFSYIVYKYFSARPMTGAGIFDKVLNSFFPSKQFDKTRLQIFKENGLLGDMLPNIVRDKVSVDERNIQDLFIDDEISEEHAYENVSINNDNTPSAPPQSPFNTMQNSFVTTAIIHDQPTLETQIEQSMQPTTSSSIDNNNDQHLLNVETHDTAQPSTSCRSNNYIINEDILNNNTPFEHQDTILNELYEIENEDMEEGMEPYKTVTDLIPDKELIDILQKKCYKFAYLDTSIKYHAYKNALIEYITYLKISHSILAKTLSQKIRSIISGVDQKTKNVYIINQNVFDKNYAIFYDGKEVYNTTGISEFKYHFVIDSEGKEKFVVPTDGMKGFSIVNKQCEKLLEPHFYEKLKGLLDFDKYTFHTKFQYSLVNGVPGCGKTSDILDKLTDKDLVLFPTKESKNDFIARLKKTKTSDFIIDKNNYLTNMSFLVRPARDVDTVYIDEARMVHPGVIFAIIQHSKCKFLHMYGDKAQIPFINRTPIINLLYIKLDSFFKITKHKSVSHRCPKDVAYICRNYYEGGKFYTTSQVEKSLFLNPKINNDQLLLDFIRNHNTKFDIIMTFTQSEKKDLLKLGINNKKILVLNTTSTVNEYQGKQCAHSLIVRTNTKPSTPIYNDPAQVLVAITRHTKTCNYITYCSSTPDQIVKHFSTYVDRTMLDSHTLLMIKETTKGGSYLSNVDYKIENTAVKLTRKSLYQTKGTFNSEYVISMIKDKIVDIDHLKSIASIDKFLNVFKHVNFSFNRDILTSEKFDILDKFHNTLPLIPTVIERFERFPIINLDKNFYYNENNSLSTDYEILQAYHDSVFGYARDTELDQFKMEYSDISYYVDDMQMSLIKIPPEFSEFSYLQPKLNTICPRPATSTQKEVLYSLIKRNFSVPELASERYLPDLVVDLFKKFKKTYLSPDRLLPEYSEIGFNTSLIFEWLRDQPATSLPNENIIEPLFSKRINYYDVTVKRSPKVTAEKDNLNVYPALQTICFQGPYFNCIFCPIIKEIRHRFMYTLKHKFKIFTDMSTEDYEDTINGFWEKLKYSFSTEIDMKKYDKSQDELMLLLEIEIFRFFGMNEYLCELWYQMHMTSVLYDRQNKIKTRCHCQRKSGDAATFLGNTLFLMTSLMVVYNLEDCILAMFAGDDSIIFSKQPYMDKTNELAFIFNLESKLFNFKNYYFCSKFLLFTEGGTFVVPDPIKLLIKLGRHDIRNFEHLDEYVTSLRDLTKCYNNSLINDALNLSVYDRYGFGYIDLHRHLYSIINSNQIYEMFYQKEGTELYPVTNNISQGKLD